MRLIDFSGSEGVNQLSKFYVRAVADTAVDLTKLIGEKLDLQVALPKDEFRYFNLMITSGRFAGEMETGLVYELELQPWIWLASKKVNARIFHKKKPDDILKEMFGEYPGGRLEERLNGAYPELEYTVQFMESDLDFMLRLMEEYGINYHFEMQKGGHTAVLTDANTGFNKGTTEQFKYNPNESKQILGDEFLTTLSEQRQITTGSIRMLDYDFKGSKSNLEVNARIDRNYAGSAKEIYEYPGRFDLENGYRATLAERRVQGVRLQDHLARASGQALSMAAGSKISVVEHPDTTLNAEYVVLSANHHFSANSYRTGNNRGEDTYRGDFVLTNSTNPVAPQRITPRPRMSGPTTAVVVDGAEGADDKYNRILVSFHWDRSGQSLPCRVSQPWAGSGWGTHFIPRAGMEVVVVFIDGDPDRPLITGCVYNDANKSPWQLPADKAISGMKSNTMDGSGYNEISIDDTAGKEKIVVHAQYDMETKVEHDSKTDVLNDATTTVTGHDKLTVKKTQTTEVTQTMKVTSHQNMTLTSDTQIELVCGSSKITMTPGSIKISAATIELAAMALLKTAALKAEHGATADLSITSAIVRINS